MMRAPLTPDELDTADEAARERARRQFAQVRAHTETLATVKRLVDALWSDDDARD
ncbi:hypothetical protein [Sphingomonas sp.]|uniref:hypothetical protein n=1 Tax=Sphingomonas sp. TaxID=28214 RepID=UPI0025DC7EF0|nr:hypothetical protein [Sphingomonas sp.]